MGASPLSLDTLLASTPRLWKGRQFSRVQTSISTGFSRLDKRLPGGGWPRGAITELIAARPGLGEFSLLFPALAEAGRAGRWLLLVDPPWVPYPATLHGHGLCLQRLLLIRTSGREESLWACEQALCGMPGGIVLAWPAEIRFAALRRLQLVAEQHGATAFLFRPEAAAAEASPAALRLRVASATEGMRIDILKCRGHAPAEPVVLRVPQCSRSETREQSTAAVARDTAAAPGAGLPYPRAPGAHRPHRRH